MPLILKAVCLGGALIFSAPSVTAAPDEVQLLVKPKAQMSEVALHALLSAHGGKEHDLIPALKVRVIRVPERAAQKLLEAMQRHHDVEYAEPDFKAEALGTANDPYYSGGYEWHLPKIQAPSAWDITTGSSSVVVAIVDTGVAASHPDLAGKVLAGYDFVSNDNDPRDDNGHGTAAAGTAAASGNNSTGIASIAWKNPVLPVKVLDAAGSGTYSAITNGIIYAADNGARIINLSLGGTSSSRTLQDAVNYAWSKNAVIIAAAGNNGNDITVYPAACQNVVAVSATNASDVTTSWSNYGSYVDVAAPGENITTLSLPDAYSYWSGTSFACPVTAGVTALMASANSELSNQQIVDLLLKNSDDLGTPGFDVSYGYGRVNAYRAVAAAKNLVVSDTSAPVTSILSPAPDATLAGTVEVSVSASDNVGVSKIEFYVDGVLLAQSASTSATFSWNTLNHLDGAHTLEARAYDAAGNVGTARTNVTVRNASTADITAPKVAITSPANNAKITGKVTKISVASSDNVGVTKLELYIDGMLFGSSTSPSATFNWNTMKIAAGAHTLQAYAYDAAGNVAASSVVTIWK